ncbi:MAG: hypothetical protein RLZZ312_573 [Bacteroidota bacterium]|jgi:hypothetical protein
MKNKYLVAFFLLSTIVVIVGALFKIVHLEVGPITGNVILTIGLLCEIFFVFVFVFKLISDKNNKFLNK